MPKTPTIDFERVAAGSGDFRDYAAVVTGSPLANFSLNVTDECGGKSLAAKAWNALWLFHLLSVACATPVCPLYSLVPGDKETYTAANKNLLFQPVSEARPAAPQQLDWAKRCQDSFGKLIKNSSFSSAMRCYGNAHYLPDIDMRIMLLWSGIEGLLSIDGELNRRLALYAALIVEGSPNQKHAYFNEVKKAYGIRSKVVHGTGVKNQTLDVGCEIAARILLDLLRRCVEIGRVPSAAELDAAAVVSTIR